MLNETEAKMLGASDFPALLGIDPWGGVVALWARMVHGWQVEQSFDMAAGHAAEDYNRALYRSRTGYELLGPAKWRHPLYPWLRCSPDDTAVTPSGRRVVELKRYNTADGWGGEGSDVVPPSIWVQVQVQAGVGLDNGDTEDAGVDVSALIRGDLRLYHVPYQPEVYGRLLDLGERFVRDFVTPSRFPDGPNLTLLERDAAALSGLFSAPKLDAPLEWDMLAPHAQEVVRRWLDANEARKAWESQEKALRPQVELLLREAPGLALAEDAGRIDFKAQAGQSRVDAKALREALRNEDPALSRRMAELLDEHTTKTTTRPLVARRKQ